MNGLSPAYLSEKFNYVANKHNVNTRQAATGLLALPPCINGSDTEYYKSSFSYSGVKIWNGINSDIRRSQTLHTFKTRYKSHVS